MRFCIAALLVLALLTAVSGANAQVDATSVDYENQTITIALTQEPPQLNSMKATDQVSIMVLSHVMEGLVGYDRRGNVVPGVAERWEMDENGATFWLRHNAQWSDGQPVTAHDFIFAWRNALKPETASEYAFILYPIQNAEAINTSGMDAEQLGAVAIDDYTLKVTFERPTAYFIKLTAFSTYFPVREDFWKSRQGTYAADPEDLLYNGPFELTDWVHSASLKMEKNQRYWNKDSIKLNAINADYITADTRARLNLFIDGKIVHTRLDGETYKDALTQRFRIRRFNTGSVFFLEYNHRPERPTSNLAPGGGVRDCPHHQVQHHHCSEAPDNCCKVGVSDDHSLESIVAVQDSVHTPGLGEERANHQRVREMTTPGKRPADPG